jgi:GT2 family glycosyltransferase/predicted Zn-dependent protease
MNPTVSIIIPCYNYGRFLRDCIESALGQSYRPIEIIVVNDGSTDETEEIGLSYGGRVQYIGQPHQGIVQTINAGIERSRGDFFYFLSADDLLFPGTVENQVRIMEGDDRCAVVCGNAKLIDEGGKEVGESIMPLPERDLLFRMLISPCLHDGSLLFRRSALEAIGELYFKPFESYHGYHHRCFQLGRKFPIRYLNEYLVFQRVHENNLSHPKNLRAMMEGYGVLRKKMRGIIDPCEILEGANPEHPGDRARAHFLIAGLYFYLGQYEIAYQDLKQAARLEPDLWLKKEITADPKLRDFLSPILPIEPICKDQCLLSSVETPKTPRVKDLLTAVKNGEMLRSFFLCQQSLEESPDDPDSLLILALIYLLQRKWHDSLNRFHHVTKDLLEKIRLCHPFHSIELYLCLALLKEEAPALSELREKSSRLGWFDVNICLWLIKAGLTLGKTELVKETQTLFKRKGLTLHHGTGRGRTDGSQNAPEIGFLNPSPDKREGAPPPLVSVIVPTYDRPDSLTEALRSILNQTYQNFEIIVVNDGGVGIENVINHLNEKKNITYIRLASNKERSAARNAGIQIARGKYVAYLDDDDTFYANHIETLVRLLETKGGGVAYTDAIRAHQIKKGATYQVVKRDVPFSRDFDVEEILVSNFIPVLSLMHEKACLDEVGFFDETLNTHEDWDLWIRMSRKFKFHHIKKTTCEFTYRQDGTSTSSGKREDFLRTLKVIYGKYHEYVKDRPDLIEAQEKFLQDLENEVYQKIISPSPAMKTPGVSIIIPVYNQIHYTRQCLKAIAETAPASAYEVIVVDNGSNDGTADFLRQEESAGRLRAIYNKENLGFARACNQGAKTVSFEYLLFLNNDTEPQKGWLESLVKILETDHAVAGVGSKLLFQDGTIQHAGVVLIDHKKLNDPLRAEHIYLKKPSDFSKANQSMFYQALTAACLLVRRSSFEQVGGFDEGYWNGYEDVDLCFKLREKGWKLVYQPESVVIHFESQSGPERFAQVPKNIERLHQKWLGRVKPDLIVEKDGIVRETQAGGIQPYSILKSPEALSQRSHQQEEKVSIVILTFNQLKYTRKCVESIQRCTPQAHEILFIDNGSTDGTVKWLRQLVRKHENYKLIENGKNLGFARGCNQGMKASTGENILLLNNDVIVTKGWLSGMLQCLKSAPEVGIVGPMTNSISGPQKVPGADYPSIDHLEEFVRSFRGRNKGRRIEVRRIVGFCMLFRRELMETIGLLDEEFGSGNFEDDDFCLRATLKGFRNFIAGDVFVHHYGSRSFIGNKINYTDALSRNRKIFQKKWGDLNSKASLSHRWMIIHLMDKADEYNQKDEIKKSLATLYEGIGLFPGERRLYEMLADMLIDTKQFQEALAVLNRMPSGDADPWKLERVGYCKEGLGHHEEADAIVNLILSLQPNSPFAWNLKGMVAYGKEDKEEAERFFKKAILLDPGFGESHTNLGVLKWTSDQREEALNLLERGFILSSIQTDAVTAYHSAITATQDFERGERIFREANALYPLNRRIAFLLIDALIQQGKNDVAMSEIEKAMIQFGIDDGILSAAMEVRNRLGTKEIDPTSQGALSLCMIVKNEESNLLRCLMSVKPVVDEMIVVDTGSTDKTKEIAGVFGAKVFDYEWADDFSEARNFSLSKVRGRWILILDADEVISPMDYSPLIRIVKERNTPAAAYSLTTRNYVEPVNISGWTANDGKYGEEAGTGWFPGAKVRLFPNDPRIRFENPVHELVEPSLKKAGIKIKECEVPIHHYGKLRMDKNQKKGEEYFLLGKKKLEERGGDFTSLYELAVQAGELGRYEEAVELWQRCVRLQPENPKAHFNLGYGLLKLGRYEEALHASARAMQLAPNFKEAIFNYSLCEFCVGDIHKAISALEGMIIKEPDYPSAVALLSAVYLLKGNREKGMETLARIKSMGYDATVTLHSFAERLISAGRRDAAILLMERAIEAQAVSDQIVTLLTQCKNTGQKEAHSFLQP